MSKVLVDDSNLLAIAEAIRNKNGTTNTYKPSEMPGSVEEVYNKGYLDGQNASGDDSNKFTDCDYLFYQGIRSNEMQQIMKHIDYVGSANCMFHQNSKLTSFPIQLDFTKCKDFYYTFRFCDNLVGKARLDLSGCSSSKINEVFRYCSKLEELELKVGTQCNNLANCFPYGTASGISTLRRFIFFETESFSKGAVFLQYCSFTREAMLETFNSLPVISSSHGPKNINITGNACVVDGTLTDEDIAIATAKNWNVITA